MEVSAVLGLRFRAEGGGALPSPSIRRRRGQSCLCGHAPGRLCQRAGKPAGVPHECHGNHPARPGCCDLAMREGFPIVQKYKTE
mmetsp:Transcript_6899/g.10688  ORF Transcript_6899/g.10688 Transcript_6899/m.10688 type:complete len:84 (+) Transcript_6899:1009-1260(+)